MACLSAEPLTEFVRRVLRHADGRITVGSHSEAHLCVGSRRAGNDVDSLRVGQNLLVGIDKQDVIIIPGEAS